MWQVNIGDQILYYPGSEDAVIYDTELNEECGLAGEFTFKVPSVNPQYSALANGAIITILRDKKEYWRGEVSNIKTDFAKVATVYCVEDLAWLGDEFIDPSSIEAFKNKTYAQVFSMVLTIYNTKRPADRRFGKTVSGVLTPGYINNRNASAICTWKTEYEWSILDSIRNIICGDNGYVRIRRQYENGTLVRYVDIVSLENYGVAASQPIEFGYNLLDYVKDSDYGNLTNVLTPYGETLEDQEVYEGYGKRLQGTTILDNSSINAYGRHAKAVVFDGVTSVNTLNNLASAYLSRYKQPQLTMEVQAVDLAEIGEADAINIGDSVRVIAKPFAVDQRLYLTQIRRDIQNIDRNTITLAGTVARKSLTSQILKITDEFEDLPSSILTAAKRNALAMLLDETQGGCVVIEYDDNNANMVAINICNDETIEASTKRWRWSENGFGYMYRSNINQAWTGPKVAMTIDGAIVADFITAGILSADRMRGGILAIGGDAGGSYKNGSIRIYNNENKQVGIWNRNGITLYDGKGTDSANVIGKWNTDGIDIRKGDINLGSGKFHVTNGGALTAQNADIKGTITSTKGTIGGFTIDDHYLRSGGTNSTQSGSVTLSNANFSRKIGDTVITNLRLAIAGNFGVSANGKLYAEDGEFKGSLSGANVTGATGTFSGTVSGGNININSGRFNVSSDGRVKIVTRGSSHEEDYLIIEDSPSHQTYIGGEYIWSTGAGESVRIADLINYYIAHR